VRREGRMLGVRSRCLNAKDKRRSASLPFRWRDGQLEVFLVHPGGPVWANKDTHTWSVAKGGVEPYENLLAAAHREFLEETGLTLVGPAIPLDPVRQAGGKLVHAWAIEADLVPSTIRSNAFPLEWPPRSGQVRQFPEVDRAAWIELAELGARSKRDRWRSSATLRQGRHRDPRSLCRL
jgi:predicted NUDIX family NTP pyrophosphohydrolase